MGWDDWRVAIAPARALTKREFAGRGGAGRVQQYADAKAAVVREILARPEQVAETEAQVRWARLARPR
jgi:hypothetical protein